MITLLLLAAAFAAVIAALTVTVRQDGYGHRPPPRSHFDSPSNTFNPFV